MAGRALALLLALQTCIGCAPGRDGGQLDASSGSRPPVAAPPSAATDAAGGTALASTQQQAALQKLLETEARALPGEAAVHVRVDGGPEAGVNADSPMPAASVIKLPLMAVVHEQWRAGKLPRSAANQEQVRKMITVSDNPGADALIKQVGAATVNAWLDAHDYPGTRLKHTLLGPRPQGHNTVTAAEMTRMLLEIARGELVDSEESRRMRETLLASERRTRIPAGLPKGTVVGNKTGTLNGIVNDVAFVEPPDGPRYAIAVLVHPAGGDATTSKAIARLSRKVYEHLTGAEQNANP